MALGYQRTVGGNPHGVRHQRGVLRYGGRTFVAHWRDEVARFHVAAVVHYTTERPDGWTAVQEAEAVRSTTQIGPYPIDDVEVTYFEAEETEGGEG
jgi:hypothetical protein